MGLDVSVKLKLELLSHTVKLEEMRTQRKTFRVKVTPPEDSVQNTIIEPLSLNPQTPLSQQPHQGLSSLAEVHFGLETF